MTNAKKRKQRNLLLLIAVMFMLIGVYAGVMIINKEKGKQEEVETAPEQISLWKLDSALADTIEYTNEYGTMALVYNKEQEVWHKKEDNDFPVNQTYMESMLNVLSSPQAQKLVVENCENLEEFGLDQPSVTASLTLTDGTKHSLQIGIKTPTEEGYYAAIDDKKDVYLIETGIHSAFRYSEMELAEKEETPSIAPESITYVKIDTEDGILEMEKDAENKWNYSGLSPWVMKGVYQNPVLMENEKVNELLQNYSSFYLKLPVEFHCTDFGKYGLDIPSIVVYLEYEEDTSNSGEEDTKNTETKKIARDYTLHIGKTDENGDYYVRIPNSDTVYTMNASNVKDLAQIDRFNLVMTMPAMVDIETVDQVEVKIGNDSHTMEISRSTEKDEEGKETKKAVYLVDGKEVEESIFKDVYSDLISISIDCEISDSKKETKETEAYITIRYKRDKGDVTVKLYPHNESFYRLELNGISEFLVNSRVIQELEGIF